MSQRNESNLDSDQRYRAVERVCAEFQLARKKNSQFCIEDILPTVGELIAPIVGLNHGSIFQEVLAELIHMEMDMRFAADEEICQFDYYRRFPDFASAIDASLERLRQLDENKKLA